MWVVGVAALIACTAFIALLTRRGQAPAPPVPLWDIPRVAAAYTTIVGSLAGFSVASAIFSANLTIVRESPNFEAVIGMFLIAFIIFLGTAMQYGTTPNLPVDDAEYLRFQRYSFHLACCGYYLGIGVSWLGLRPLLLAIGLDYVADVFTWILFVSVLAGALRTANFLNRTTHIDRRTTLAITGIGFGGVAVYKLLLVSLLGSLWVGDNEAFLFAVICFALAGVGFASQSALLGSQDMPNARAILNRLGDSYLLIFSQATITAVALLWFAVADI